MFIKYKGVTIEAVDQLVYKGFCEYTGKLFSEVEINYLSYILDDKKYYYFTISTSGKNNQNTIYRYKEHVLYPKVS